MRVKGKHIITNVGAPTKVSDMKEGEMRSDATSLYGRVGNQILHKDWVAQELSTVKCTGAVDDDDFATISFPWSENDANNIAAPGVNGWENFGLANGEAWVGWAAETTAGQYDVCLYVDIFDQFVVFFNTCIKN